MLQASHPCPFHRYVPTGFIYLVLKEESFIGKQSVLLKLNTRGARMQPFRFQSVGHNLCLKGMEDASCDIQSTPLLSHLWILTPLQLTVPFLLSQDQICTVQAEHFWLLQNLCLSHQLNGAQNVICFRFRLLPQSWLAKLPLTSTAKGYASSSRDLTPVFQ